MVAHGHNPLMVSMLWYQQRSSRSLVLLWGKIHIINTGFPKDWGFQLSTIIVSFFPSISAKSGRLAVSTSRRERTNPTRDQFQTLKLWRNWGCSQHLVNLVPRNWLEPWKQQGTSIVGVAWTFITMSRVFSANVALLYSWQPLIQLARTFMTGVQWLSPSL
jgi:hypothetical protein